VPYSSARLVLYFFRNASRALSGSRNASEPSRVSKLNMWPFRGGVGHGVCLALDLWIRSHQPFIERQVLCIFIVAGFRHANTSQTDSLPTPHTGGRPVPRFGFVVIDSTDVFATLSASPNLSTFLPPPWARSGLPPPRPSSSA